MRCISLPVTTILAEGRLKECRIAEKKRPFCPEQSRDTARSRTHILKSKSRQSDFSTISGLMRDSPLCVSDQTHLFRKAQARACELTESFSHTHPDGSDCSVVEAVVLFVIRQKKTLPTTNLDV